MQIVDVDARSTAYLYLGTVDIDGKIQSWVFLSKEKFWAWWEWVILTDELNPYVNFRQGSVDETAYTKESANKPAYSRRPYQRQPSLSKHGMYRL